MRLSLAALFMIVAACAGAQPVEELQRPGVVALMRHALAPGFGDPERFELGDCTTQRNLDERGREQARRTGDALRDAGVEFDAVWTSQWCRTRETAELLDMGEPQGKPPLNSFFAGRGDRARQTRETLELIADLPPDTRLLIVTHQVNISALTGQGVRSGEIVVTRRSEDGLEPVASFIIAP